MKRLTIQDFWKADGSFSHAIILENGWRIDDFLEYGRLLERCKCRSCKCKQKKERQMSRSIGTLGEKMEEQEVMVETSAHEHEFTGPVTLNKAVLLEQAGSGTDVHSVQLTARSNVKADLIRPAGSGNVREFRGRGATSQWAGDVRDNGGVEPCDDFTLELDDKETVLVNWVVIE